MHCKAVQSMATLYSNKMLKTQSKLYHCCNA